MEKISTEFCKLVTSDKLEKAKIVFNNLDKSTKELYLLVASKILKNPKNFSKTTTTTAYNVLKILNAIHHINNKFTFTNKNNTFNNVNTDLNLNTLEVLKQLAESLGITG